MRWLSIGLIILLIVVSIILCVSNWQPVTLFFLGNSGQTALFSLSLPLALWVLLFTFTGFVTGLIIQVLNRFSRPNSSPRRPRKNFDPPSPKPDPLSSDRNWDNTLPDEWNIEEPPKKPTQPEYSQPKMPQSPKPPIQDHFKVDSSSVSPPPPQVPSPSAEKTPDPPRSSEFEVSQSPKRATREGSVYTYTYREKTDSDRSSKSSPSSRQSNPNQIYDAAYRVITPPYREPVTDNSQEEDNEEDWI